MMRNKIGICLLIACVGMVQLTGCGKKVEKKDSIIEIKVAFWGSPEEKEIITESVSEWQAAHPEISIRFEHTPAGGYVQKMLTRIAGGAAPDILCVRVDQFVSFAKRKTLLNLSQFIDGDTSFDITKYFPQVVESFSYDGNVYAVPRDTAPYACVFFNKDRFDQQGVPYPTNDWTWEDMLAKAQALTSIDDRGRKYYGYYGWAWENFVYSNGGDLVDNLKHPTRCLLDTPEAIEGLQFYGDLINKYEVMPTPVALSNTGMGVDMMFADGNIAMFQSGVWETPSLLTYEDLKWGVVMFPKNKNGLRRFGTGGSAYGILSSTKHPETAWEVLKVLAGPIGQKQLADRGLAQPAIMEIAEDWANNPVPPKNKSMLNEAVKYVVYDPFHEKWLEARAKYVIPQLELLFNGKQSAQEAVDKFIEPVNSMLQEK